MDNSDALIIANNILISESTYLDKRSWDKWLALFTQDCVFHVPAWIDEFHETSDPERQLSLIYCNSRAALEERIWRIRSGTSVASVPLPRTLHSFTNLRIKTFDQFRIESEANWTVHSFSIAKNSTFTFYGHYEHIFCNRNGDGWFISKKTIHLLNDILPAILDVYLI